MSFRKFEILILLQLCLVALNSFLIAWTFFQEHLKVSTVYFSLVLVLQIVILFLHISKQHKSIVRFLESMRHRDELSKLSEKNSPGSHKQLLHLLNEIAESYSQVKIEKESEHFYFLNTIKHVNVGLISFDDKGQVELMNESAEKLLKISKIKHIDQIEEILSGTGVVLSELEPGKPRLVKLRREGEMLQLSLRSTIFFIKDRKIILVSIQDIRNEIQQEEIEIWQKLIRVLTHEIMNSVGPITSLSSTISDTFRDEIKPTRIGEKNYDRIVIGLRAIQKRSRGLARFVETYRNLTKLPEPIIQDVRASELCKQLAALLEEELESNDVHLYTQIDPLDLLLPIDEKLISQMIINLVRNSIEALKGCSDKRIRILVQAAPGTAVQILVEDNGKGIPEEIQERVFVPFFTTRPEGSGIGLSLSRQIMTLHGGSINLYSKVGEGTVVKMIF